MNMCKMDNFFGIMAKRNLSSSKEKKFSYLVIFEFKLKMLHKNSPQLVD